MLMKNKLKFIKHFNVMIIDLETTGLPQNNKTDIYFHYTDNSKYDTSRIIQIAWTYIEQFDFDKLKNCQINCYIRKPTDFKKISEKAIAIHGITYEKAKNKGITLSNIINNQNLKNQLSKCDYIIAHNAVFDISILLNEFNRLKFNECVSKLKKLIQKKQIICTGEYSKDICKLPFMTSKNHTYGAYKMPRLTELYEFYYRKIQRNIDTTIYILKYAPEPSTELYNFFNSRVTEKSSVTVSNIKNNVDMIMSIANHPDDLIKKLYDFFYNETHTKRHDAKNDVRAIVQILQRTDDSTANLEKLNNSFPKFDLNNKLNELMVL